MQGSNDMPPGHPGFMPMLLSKPELVSSGAIPARKGKWSEEEEKLTKKLIKAFNDGLLQIPIGTTLRTFLAEKLFWLVFTFPLHKFPIHLIFKRCSSI
jgi:hypothetical protein